MSLLELFRSEPITVTALERIEVSIVGDELEIQNRDIADERRHCSTCKNLSAGRCLAAWRGEIVAAKHYRPVDDLPRRCEGYVPKANDTDQRTGKQRWPALEHAAWLKRLTLKPKGLR